MGGQFDGDGGSGGEPAAAGRLMRTGHDLRSTANGSGCSRNAQSAGQPKKEREMLKLAIRNAVAGLALAALLPGWAGASSDIEITTLSTRADMVTGGDVLVRIEVPPGLAS